MIDDDDLKSINYDNFDEKLCCEDAHKEKLKNKDSGVHSQKNESGAPENSSSDSYAEGRSASEDIDQEGDASDNLKSRNLKIYRCFSRWATKHCFVHKTRKGNCEGNRLHVHYLNSLLNALFRL